MTEISKEQLEQINVVISKLENKDFGLYFFTLDTKGNPTAGVANIYEHVKVLNSLGYKAVILHEKNDYKLRGDEQGHGIADWLGEEYASLPHLSIESQQLNVGSADFIIIPEIFANIMDQVKAFPCKKVVFSQNYDYLLELLPMGKRWNLDYGFNDVITTSRKQAEYLSNLFPAINTHVVPVSIPSYFKPSNKPKEPIIAVLTRNQGDVVKIVKSFYLQYPIYKWLSFKDLRGLKREDFAKDLGKCCLAIWIDDTAGFGTFPLESFQCETPIIVKVPKMLPEYMEGINAEGQTVIKNNTIYTSTDLNIPELIATYMKTWLEDMVPQEFTNELLASKNQYTPERQRIEIDEVYNTLVTNRINEFKAMLPKLETNAL